MDPSQTEARIATFGDMYVKTSVDTFLADFYSFNPTIRGTVMPMGFEVTDQMIADDKDLNFQLIVHAGDIAYAGVSHSWEFEVSMIIIVTTHNLTSVRSCCLSGSTFGICGENKSLLWPTTFPTWWLLVRSPSRLTFLGPHPTDFILARTKAITRNTTTFPHSRPVSTCPAIKAAAWVTFITALTTVASTSCACAQKFMPTPTPKEPHNMPGWKRFTLTVELVGTYSDRRMRFLRAGFGCRQRKQEELALHYYRWPPYGYSSVVTVCSPAHYVGSRTRSYVLLRQGDKQWTTSGRP